jgi:rhodanese-related sulfurtransferase
MVRQITVAELKALLDGGKPVHLVDVREPWEHALAALQHSQLVPLGELAARADEVAPPEGALVVAYCHHGVRSLRGAALLAAQGLDAVSLAGGIDRWSLEIDPSIPRY